jgi:hypothetical protein
MIFQEYCFGTSPTDRRLSGPVANGKSVADGLSEGVIRVIGGRMDVDEEFHR